MTEYLKIRLDIHNAPFSKQIDHVPSCFDDIISTVCTAYKLDYFPMFASSYSFLLSDKDEAHYMQIDTKDDLSELLYGCSGLSYVHKYKTDTEELYSVILDELKEKRPVAIHFDAFYCPWDKLNGKIHNDHMVLVSGIDEESSQLFVCDPWFDKEEWIPADLLDVACGYYVIFSFEVFDVSEIDDEYLISNLNRAINRDGQNVFDNIRKFAERLPTEFDFSDLNASNFFDSSCSKTIQRVVYSRCKYLAFLYYMIPKSRMITKEKCIEFGRFLVAWRIVQNLFAKAYIQKIAPGSPFLQHLSNKIISIADEEEKFLTDTIFRQTNAEYLDTVSDFNILKNKEAKNIDLSDYLNNRAFDCIYAKYNANFTGKKSFLLLNEESIKEEYTINDVKVPLWQNIEKEYDNVICLGQEIACEAKNVSGLLICACAEFGNYSDYWKIVDENGREHCFKVTVSDHSSSPRSDETVVYTTDKCGRRNDGVAVVARENCHIFAEQVCFDSRMNVEKIILPNCPCMHVFSVVLL